MISRKNAQTIDNVFSRGRRGISKMEQPTMYNGRETCVPSLIRRHFHERFSCLYSTSLKNINMTSTVLERVSFMMINIIESRGMEREVRKIYRGSSNLTSTAALRASPTIVERRTTIFAASSKLSHANILRLLAAMMALASST